MEKLWNFSSLYYAIIINRSTSVFAVTAVPAVLAVSHAEFYRLEAHLLRQRHLLQVLLLVQRRRSFLFHLVQYQVAVRAVLARAKFRAFHSAWKTGAVLLVALYFLAGAELPFALHHGTTLQYLHCFFTDFGVEFVFAISTLAKGSTDCIVGEAFAVGLETLSILTCAELSSIGHDQRVLHLDAGLATRATHTEFIPSKETRTGLATAFRVAIAGVVHLVLLVFKLLVKHADFIIFQIYYNLSRFPKKHLVEQSLQDCFEETIDHITLLCCLFCL